MPEATPRVPYGERIQHVGYYAQFLFLIVVTVFFSVYFLFFLMYAITGLVDVFISAFVLIFSAEGYDLHVSTAWFCIQNNLRINYANETTVLLNVTTTDKWRQNIHLNAVLNNTVPYDEMPFSELVAILRSRILSTNTDTLFFAYVLLVLVTCFTACCACVFDNSKELHLLREYHRITSRNMDAKTGTP